MEDNLVRVAAVTGATGAIGKAIALNIAKDLETEVVLICRNEDKARKTVDNIKSATRNQRVRFELVDLSQLVSIRSLAQRWQGPLHVLVNNAAVTPRRRLETPQGIEMQFATNVLGYVWMALVFRDKLFQAAPSRVVNVASYWAGDLDLDDLEFRRRRYDNNRAYRQSKQANRMLTVAFAQRWKSYGVSVNACHPGDVNSKLSNDLGFGGHETPDKAAMTPVWLATSSIGEEKTGRYYEHMRETSCRFARDKGAVEALYEICMRYDHPTRL